jgi:CheY-like chemotaxis protein
MTQLEQWNFVPVLAGTAAHALEILSFGHDIELVITDMQMPCMDGVGLASSIRAVNKQIPIILLSFIGNDQKDQHEHLFAHILTKPVKQKMLANALRNVFMKAEKETITSEVSHSKLSEDFARRFPLNILVAEDNPVNQRLIIRTLKKMGYDPAAAVNGILTVEEIGRNFYDIILMDIQMPEMDGLEATRVIRNGNSRQPIIIAMTANALAEDIAACLDAGMDDYISKPVKLEQLVKALEKWALFIQTKKASLLR